MSVNSSCSSNDFHLHPNLSSADSYLPYGIDCLVTTPGSLIFVAFTITSVVLLLPLCIFIFYLGLQQWRRERSKATTKSHSDIITYQMVTMELVDVAGCILCCCAILWCHASLVAVGLFLWTFTWYGETFFHILTSAEHYLAVVHPVTYLSLRGERGIRIRNVTIVCIWLLSIGGMSLMILESIFLVVNLCLLGFSLMVISFFSLSVLYILIRPGPGEQGGERGRVDQSKHRAFFSIVAILGVLFLRCFWNLVWVLIVLVGSGECVIMVSGIWFNLPSRLVLPLLFLHRAGTFACCKKNRLVKRL